MRLGQFIVFASFSVASAALVAAGQAPVKAPSGGQATEKSLGQLRQEQATSQAEVARLKGDVTRQQADSERAGERLEKQDKAIAELRKQLQELQSVQSGNHR